MSNLEGYDVLEDASRVATQYSSTFYPDKPPSNSQSFSESDLYICDPNERLERCLEISNTLIGALKRSSSDPKLQFLGVNHSKEIPNQTSASFIIFKYDIALVTNNNVNRININDGSRNLAITMAKVKGEYAYANLTFSDNKGRYDANNYQSTFTKAKDFVDEITGVLSK